MNQARRHWFAFSDKTSSGHRRLSSFTADEFTSEFLLCRRILGVRRRVRDEYKSRHGREGELRQR
jgi:hypothetical protein